VTLPLSYSRFAPLQIYHGAVRLRAGLLALRCE
jgi:hypothetical protein